MSSGPSGSVCTADRDERVEGVMCVAAPAGYDVVLRLVCEMVPLPALGSRVQAAVRAAAGAARIPVTSVSVEIIDVMDGTPANLLFDAMDGTS
jgi:hypothetical protein